MAPSVGGLREQLAVVASSGPFRTLLLAWVLQALATGTMLAGADYVARWVLRDAGASTLILVAFVGPAIVETPLWERVGVRAGKKLRGQPDRGVHGGVDRGGDPRARARHRAVRARARHGRVRRLEAGAVTQPPSAVTAALVGFTAVPAVLVALSLVPLLLHRPASEGVRPGRST